MQGPGYRVELHVSAVNPYSGGGRFLLHFGGVLSEGLAPQRVPAMTQRKRYLDPTKRSRTRVMLCRHLKFEPLEDRRLLSVTVDLASRTTVPSASAMGSSTISDFYETHGDAISADGRY